LSETNASAEQSRTPPNRTRGAVVIHMTISLIIGALGGWVFSLFQVPLAWMLGSMITATIIAMSGGTFLERPIKLRAGMLIVMGVMLGSSFTPAVMERISEWLMTLSVMTVFVVVVTVIGWWGLRRLTAFDPVTSYFSAVPGGFTVMVVTGGAMGGDEKTIALIHSLRIMLTVLTIPLWFRLADGVVPADIMAHQSSFGDLTFTDTAVLIALGGIGALAGKLIRMPTYVLVGPMVLSAAAHLSGLTAAKPPIELVNAAQVVIGTSIGCRFLGVIIRDVPRTMMCGAFTGFYLLAAGALVALMLEPYTSATFPALWLAFAPGGLPEMALMSIALGVDPAFVATHHLYRIVLLLVLAPVAYGLYQRWRASAPTASDTDP
jgi:uncharacterized protein